MSLHSESVVALILISLFGCYASQEGPALPARLSPSITGGISGSCPSSEALNTLINDTKGEIRNILRDTVIPILECPCGGPGQWTRIAHLDMSDPNQQCPVNWNLTTTSVRGCGRSSDGCHSAFFPSNGRSYSRVCGRVNALQKGSPNAFHPSVVGGVDSLEDTYIDGVSLTHGAAGLRQHIWTFAAALYETDPSFGLQYVCSCTNTALNWPYQVPSFVGNNYFCATGNPGPGFDRTTVYSEDPLWDGEGCGPTNACCQFNSPPWFCTTTQPTTDNIELRICADGGIADDEDVIVELVDIYIM